jgi:hypothetical protein
MSYNTRPRSSADQPAAQSMSNVRQRTSQFMSVNHLIVRVRRNYTASFVLRLMKKDKTVLRSEPFYVTRLLIYLLIKIRHIYLLLGA